MRRCCHNRCEKNFILLTTMLALLGEGGGGPITSTRETADSWSPLDSRLERNFKTHKLRLTRCVNFQKQQQRHKNQWDISLIYIYFWITTIFVFTEFTLKRYRTRCLSLKILINVYQLYTSSDWSSKPPSQSKPQYPHVQNYLGFRLADQK